MSNTGTVLLLALGVFLLSGVYSLLKQGIRGLALVVLVLGLLAITGGVLRL